MPGCVTLVPREDRAVVVDPRQSENQTAGSSAEMRCVLLSRNSISSVNSISLLHCISPVPDAVRTCLSCVAVPRLSPSVSIFKLIWSLSQRIQPPEQQFETLVLSVAQLLQTLGGEFQTGHIPPHSGHTEIAALYRCCQSVY
jgi:hypothetical protein